jgi:hypothetical protein
MFAEAQELIEEGLDGNAPILVVRLAPFLPGVAAAPPAMIENAVAVGAFHEGFVFQLAFQMNDVQTHFLHVTELCIAAGFVHPQHHVGRPATAAHRNRFRCS